jgi:hypothetical protein
MPRGIVRGFAGPVAAAWSRHRVTRLQSFGVAMREDRFAGRASLRVAVITVYYSGVVTIRQLLPFLSASRSDAVTHSTIAVRRIRAARSLRRTSRCPRSVSNEVEKEVEKGFHCVGYFAWLKGENTDYARIVRCRYGSSYRYYTGTNTGENCLRILTRTA